MGILLALVILCFVASLIMEISVYKTKRKYPERIKLEDVNFIEDNKKIEINMVSGKTEFIYFDKYQEEFEKSKTKGYININGLFINIDNIESTSLHRYGKAKYKDLEFSYHTHREEVKMCTSVKNTTILYTLNNDDIFFKTIS